MSDRRKRWDLWDRTRRGQKPDYLLEMRQTPLRDKDRLPDPTVRNLLRMAPIRRQKRIENARTRARALRIPDSAALWLRRASVNIGGVLNEVRKVILKAACDNSDLNERDTPVQFMRFCAAVFDLEASFGPLRCEVPSTFFKWLNRFPFRKGRALESRDGQVAPPGIDLNLVVAPQRTRLGRKQRRLLPATLHSWCIENSVNTMRVLRELQRASTKSGSSVPERNENAAASKFAAFCARLRTLHQRYGHFRCDPPEVLAAWLLQFPLRRPSDSATDASNPKC